MGTYLGVKAVQKIGTPVMAVQMNKKPSIPSGNFLVAIMCNGVSAVAPEVTKESEYKEFVNGYNQGNWLSMRLYLVPNEQRDNCPDKGRQPCSV